MEAITEKLNRHDDDIRDIRADICKLKDADKNFEKFMATTELQYKHLEKAISKKAEFWDKVKVSIYTSVGLFFIYWILNSSPIFK